MEVHFPSLIPTGENCLQNQLERKRKCIEKLKCVIFKQLPNGQVEGNTSLEPTKAEVDQQQNTEELNGETTESSSSAAARSYLRYANAQKRVHSHSQQLQRILMRTTTTTPTNKRRSRRMPAGGSSYVCPSQPNSNRRLALAGPKPLVLAPYVNSVVFKHPILEPEHPGYSTPETSPKPNRPPTPPPKPIKNSGSQNTCCKCDQSNQSGKQDNRKRNNDKNQESASCKCCKRPIIVVPSSYPKGYKTSAPTTEGEKRRRSRPPNQKTSSDKRQPEPQQQNICCNNCNDCALIPQISEQLSQLQKQLQAQSSPQLREITEQVRQLCSTVESLKTCSKPCSSTVQEKPSAASTEYVDIPCEAGQSESTIPLQSKLQWKASSVCQFCRDKNLPVCDENLDCQLFRLIGPLPLSDIVLTVLLRSDNLYHINVRELKTGNALGCLLVSNNAIEEAIKAGLFEEVLTFCVIDVRNTLQPRDRPFGITFEFIREPRERGGKYMSERSRPEIITLYSKKMAANVLGLEENNLNAKFSKKELTKAAKKMTGGATTGKAKNCLKYSTSKAVLAIAGINSRFVLSDADRKYRARSLVVDSFSDTEQSLSDTSSGGRLGGGEEKTFDQQVMISEISSSASIRKCHTFCNIFEFAKNRSI